MTNPSKTTSSGDESSAPETTVLNEKLDLMSQLVGLKSEYNRLTENMSARKKEILNECINQKIQGSISDNELNTCKENIDFLNEFNDFNIQISNLTREIKDIEARLKHGTPRK